MMVTAESGLAVVVWWNDDKGFGFLKPETPGPDLFVHHSCLRGQGRHSLVLGAQVRYHGLHTDDAGRARVTLVEALPENTKTAVPPVGSLCWCATPQEGESGRTWKGPCTVQAIQRSIVTVTTPHGAQWDVSTRFLKAYQPHPDGCTVAWVDAKTQDKYCPADRRTVQTRICLPAAATSTARHRDQNVSLLFVFVVSGPLCDSQAGSMMASSWTEPDAAHAWRRDALARCIAAALWEQTASESGELHSAHIHQDVRVCLLYPRGGYRVWIEALDFAGVACGGHALELVILRRLDQAALHVRALGGPTAQVAPAVAGLRVMAGGDGIDGVADALLSEAGVSEHTIVAALRETRSHCILGSNGSGRTGASGAAMQGVFVLGVVDDNDDAVDAVISASKRLGLRNTRVNVGPIAEFSSKVVHLVNFLHGRGELAPALERSAASAEAPQHPLCRVSDSAKTEQAEPVCQLHFWVFCEWLSGTDCVPAPSSGKNPILLRDGAVSGPFSYAARSRSALLAGVLLAALARSHGAHDGSRVTLVLGADTVLTVGSSLVRKHLARRGHGAMTEHHLLVALGAAADDDASVRSGSFEEAWRKWGDNMAIKTTLRRRRWELAQRQSSTPAAELCVGREISAAADPSVTAATTLDSRVLCICDDGAGSCEEGRSAQRWIMLPKLVQPAVAADARGHDRGAPPPLLHVLLGLGLDAASKRVPPPLGGAAIAARSLGPISVCRAIGALHCLNSVGALWKAASATSTD